VLLFAQCTDHRDDRVAALPANAPADYQIGGDYEPPIGVEVVVRDWFSGSPLADGYSICYVNAFQTQDDSDDVHRPDERSQWPGELVLSELGDDPNWPGEYLIDIGTSERRETAAAWVGQMIQTCAAKGFDAVEFDNLDSWTRFDGTPVADDVPFGEADAEAYATLLTAAAHARGMVSAQKNAVELTGATADRIGFDFLIVENCGEHAECDDAAEQYGDQVLAVEYEEAGFLAACDVIGGRSSVVLRDLELSRSDSREYAYDEC
jgi:Glycoside-hydrolase family GH114